MELKYLLAIDGALFILVALVVLVTPSPQPTLTSNVDAFALGALEDTRRLLASMFLGSGLLAAVLAWAVEDPHALVLGARARLLTLLLVITLNVVQLRSGRWKPASLYVLISIFVPLSLLYGYFGFVR